MLIKKNDIGLFFQIFIYLIPVGFIQNRTIMVLWYAFLFINMIITVANAVKGKVLRKPNGVLCLMFLYLFFQSLSTYLNHGAWIRGIFTEIVVVCLMIFTITRIERSFSQFLRVFDAVLLVEILTEITLYLFDLGHFLMDFPCVYIYYSVWAVVRLLNAQQGNAKGRILYYITGFIIVVTIVKPQINSDGTNNYEWTLYIASILMCFVYYNRNFIYKQGQWLNIKSVYFIVLVFNLVIVVFQNLSIIPGVKFLLVNIMHKDITLSGRTSIWAMAIARIVEKPIWGYGSSFTELNNSSDFWTHWLAVYGPHNQFLAICLAGGTITLLSYIILCIGSTIRLSKCKCNPNAMILCIGFLSIYILLSLTYRNIINCFPIYILFMIAYRIDDLNEKSNPQLCWGEWNSWKR